MNTTDQDLPGLEIRALRSYLSDHLDGVVDDRPLKADLLAGGRSNITYRLHQGDRSWVLRRPPLGNIMPSAHDMVREHRVLTGLHVAGFPAPRPLLLCEETAVIGAQFMMMDHVDGRVVADAADAAELTTHEADAISDAMVSTFAKLHAIDVEACGLRTLGRPEGYLERQVGRWAEQWQLTKTREMPEIDELVRWLTTRVNRLPGDLPWSMVHGDYRLDNVILARAEPEIIAVLDWEMSTLGDPVSDLAVSLVYWSEAGDGLRGNIPVAENVTAGDGFWTRQQIVDRYAALTGSDLGHLDECLALACFKLAVIMESIHRRTLDGEQVGSAATDPGMGRAAEALAQLGISVVREGGVGSLGR